MADNKTSIVITATDQTRQAVESAKAGLSSLESQAASLGVALGGIGAGLSAAGLASMVKGVIDAADNLNDLSKSTGLAVEQLSGLKLAANQSGTDLEGVAASVNKLSVNIGKNAEKFAELGITSKDPLEAFKQLADIFVAIKDPQERAAIAAEALGKSWGSAAPLLAEGGQRIGEMVDKGTRLSGVTTAMANDADELNDRLAELNATLDGMKVQSVSPLIPMLKDVADYFGQSGDEAKRANEEVGALGILFQTLVVLGANVAFVLQGVGREIGGIAAQMSALATLDIQGFSAISDAMKADAERARKELDDFEKKIMNPRQRAAAAKPAGAQATDPDLQKRASNFISSGDAQRAAKKSAGPIDVFGNSSFVTRDKDAAEFIRKQQEAINDLDRAMAQDGIKAAEEYQKRLDALVSDTPIVKTAQLMDNIALLDEALMAGKISAEVHGQAIDGLTGKMADLSDSGKKDFEELQRAIEGWGKASAEAIVDFAFTGKMSVGDMVNSILKDLARMAVYKNVTSQLVDAFSGGDIMKTLGSFFGGGRASGGPVNPGQFYVVGENGPEILVPNSAGTVIPNGGGVAGGSTYHVAVSVDARGGQVTGDNAQASELGRRIEAAVRGVLLAEKRPGGMLAA